jgi:prepilin-type N-terminal cleavage/methylation domain-containing protein
MAAKGEMMISRTGALLNNKHHSPKCGMTLIELICVMSILCTVLAITAPSLSEFFKGRVLEEEGRRMFALTKYARSQAVSRSVLVELWINPESGEYGIRPGDGYTDDNDLDISYQLGEGLYFEADVNEYDDEGLVCIQFSADGAIDVESIDEFKICRNEEDVILFKKQASVMGYIIEDEEEID